MTQPEKKKKEREKEIITTAELRALVFWAGIGFSQSRSGSYQDIPEIYHKWAKILGLSDKRKKFKTGTKQILWLTPKAANELWCATVNRTAKVPNNVKYELYRIRKLLKN